VKIGARGARHRRILDLGSRTSPSLVEGMARTGVKLTRPVLLIVLLFAVAAPISCGRSDSNSDSDSDSGAAGGVPSDVEIAQAIAGAKRSLQGAPTLPEVWLLAPFLEAAYGVSPDELVGRNDPDAIATSDPASDRLRDLALGAWGAQPTPGELRELAAYLSGLEGFDAVTVPPLRCNDVALPPTYMDSFDRWTSPDAVSGELDSALEHGLIGLAGAIWNECEGPPRAELDRGRTELDRALSARLSSDTPSSTLDARCGLVAAVGAVNPVGFESYASDTVELVLAQQRDSGAVQDANLRGDGSLMASRAESGPHTTLLCLWTLLEYQDASAPSWFALPGAMGDFRPQAPVVATGEG
jgi:hypothetical protein